MFSIRDRKRLVSIGKDLNTLTKEDIQYILDEKHSEKEVNARMAKARTRVIEKEMIQPKCKFSGIINLLKEEPAINIVKHSIEKEAEDVLLTLS